MSSQCVWPLICTVHHRHTPPTSLTNTNMKLAFLWASNKASICNVCIPYNMALVLPAHLALGWDSCIHVGLPLFLDHVSHSGIMCLSWLYLLSYPEAIGPPPFSFLLRRRTGGCGGGGGVDSAVGSCALRSLWSLRCGAQKERTGRAGLKTAHDESHWLSGT